MMRSGLVLLALLAPVQAFAARHELSVESLAVFHNDPTIDAVAASDISQSVAVRGGGALVQDFHHFGLVLDGGWGHSRQGANFDTTTSDQAVGYSSLIEFDTLVVGVKADYGVRNLFYPYVHAQVGAVIGTARLDDDLDRDDNTNQIVAHGAAPVGLFGLGFELMLPDLAKDWPLTAAVFFEGGYEAAGNMKFGDLGGQTNLSGGVFRAGVGLRFR